MYKNSENHIKKETKITKLWKNEVNLAKLHENLEKKSEITWKDSQSSKRIVKLTKFEKLSKSVPKIAKLLMNEANLAKLRKMEVTVTILHKN